MRCREVKWRMIEAAGEYDRDLIEHLRTCPSCADAAEATNVLKGLLARDNSEEPIPTFDEIRNRVETAAEGQSTLEKIMSLTKLFIFSRPKLAASLSLAIMLFLFIMLVPFTYTSVAGYKITAAISGRVSVVEQKLLEIAISGIGYKGVTVTVSEQPRQYLIAGLPTRGDAEALGAIIKNLITLKGEPIIEPIQMEASGTIYAQALEKVKPEDCAEARLWKDKNEIYLRDFYFDGSLLNANLSDAEIISRIEKVLADRGFTPGQISITCSTKTSDGSRTASLSISLYDRDNVTVSGKAKSDGGARMLSFTSLPEEEKEQKLRLEIGTDSNKNPQYEIYINDKPLKIKRGKDEMTGDLKGFPRIMLAFKNKDENGKHLIIELSPDSTGK